jgi:hypothetical protein
MPNGQRFSGEGLANPQEVRNHLIGEVRDNYRKLHDDLSVVTTLPLGQPEHTTRAPWLPGRTARNPTARHVRSRDGRRVPLWTVGLRGAGHHGLAVQSRPRGIAGDGLLAIQTQSRCGFFDLGGAQLALGPASGRIS